MHSCLCERSIAGGELLSFAISFFSGAGHYGVRE
jgi:hypothetical protein